MDSDPDDPMPVVDSDHDPDDPPPLVMDIEKDPPAAKRKTMTAVGPTLPKAIMVRNHAPPY